MKHKNKNLDESKVEDIRDWNEDEALELLECLGYIDPVTGLPIDPNDFSFDRITDDGRYQFLRVLPITQSLNDAKSAGTSTNCFKTQEDLSEIKKRGGWGSLDDREVVVGLLREFIKGNTDYDRFFNWVRAQRRCPENHLESRIHAIKIQHVRAILKGIDKSKGLPIAQKKTSIDIAKTFLIDCAMMSQISQDVLTHSSSYDFSNLSTDETKGATELVASGYILLVAKSIIKLEQAFDHSAKLIFVEHVHNKIGISKTTYYNYMDYYYFITKYRKFENLPVAYRVFIRMIPKVKQWFTTSECQALDHSECTSEKYWTDYDDEVDDEDEDEEEDDGMEISPDIRLSTKVAKISKNSTSSYGCFSSSNALEELKQVEKVTSDNEETSDKSKMLTQPRTLEEFFNRPSRASVYDS
ncbi:hypothetical protein HK100_002690 [Physocladia obscura]|uniref:Uncharacterized protein n=1 Tax=Physocladia obscura TaxID=109957 RepID=A0AAD5XF90_9FUNG|nr:hypothetical protein HK100_002690 [Physocladia obscura]